MSWKSQGSYNKIENNSTLVVNNLVTDNFILKSIYRGQWDICGGLTVKDESIFKGNIVSCSIYQGVGVKVLARGCGACLGLGYKRFMKPECS